MTSVTSEGTTVGPTGAPLPAAAPWYRDSARLALLVFVAVELGALVWWYRLARGGSFNTDEWIYLSGEGWGTHELFGPYNGHWVTLPTLVYRAFYALIGLRSYLLYQSVTIVLQLLTAVLLRVIMRRAGVGPWIATAAATVFVLLGAGAENVLTAFQMTFSAALALGLVHLILIDHDGPVDWRDWAGLGAGLAALMFSGVGAAMVIVVGVAALIRRGWRVAALHVVPLASIYALWLVVARNWGRYRLGEGDVVPKTVGRFVTTALGATFGALGQVPGIAWVLGAVLVVGSVLAWTQTPPSQRRVRFAMPVALVVGMVAFIVVTGVGRSHAGLDWARQSRYLGIQAAMLLPALAIAASALARRWRVLGPVMFVLLLVGLPKNFSLADEWAAQVRGYSSVRHRVELLAHDPLAREVPRSMTFFDPPGVTVGWLRDGAESGRIPKTRPTSRQDASDVNVLLSVMQVPGRTEKPCHRLRIPMPVELEKGQWIGVRRGAVVVKDLSPLNGVTSSSGFGTSELRPAYEHRLIATVRPLELLLLPSKPYGFVCAVSSDDESP